MRAYTSLLALCLLAGCASQQRRAEMPDHGPIDIGLKQGLKAEIVSDHLGNPTHVSFRPSDGALTICASADGNVIMVDGKTWIVRDGFDLEYWKKVSPTEHFYHIGPLFAVWLPDNTIAVGDGGKPDGKEVVAFYKGAGKAADALGVTNAIGPTSDPAVETDKGEGNFVGPVLSKDGNTIYLCSHGNDAKTWLMSVDVKTRKLTTLLSSDEGGVSTNAPMQCLLVRDHLMVVYNGAGGKDDGLVVEWDLATKKPVNQWKLPGLLDPMGMAAIAGKTDEYVITDNNWDLRSVKDGKLARVKLVPGKEAVIEVIADKVKGPVHCAFGPDKRLYVACLGSMYDQDKGMVIAIEGIK